VPPGAVEQQHGVRTFGDMAADFIEMKLHGLGIGKRQRQRRPGSPRRADGAEQVGALVALVGGLAGARPPPGPLPHNAVLLADAGLVLEPDLDRCSLGQIGQMRAQRAGEVFL
jgi:hypothetical protein